MPPPKSVTSPPAGDPKKLKKLKKQAEIAVLVFYSILRMLRFGLRRAFYPLDWAARRSCCAFLALGSEMLRRTKPTNETRG